MWAGVKLGIQAINTSEPENLGCFDLRNHKPLPDRNCIGLWILSMKKSQSSNSLTLQTSLIPGP